MANSNDKKPEKKKAKGMANLALESGTYKTTFNQKFLKREPYQAVDPKKIFAFIPGKIKKVYVKKGSRVKEGDRLLVLEAMKMNNMIFAPQKGTIKEIYVTQGISVAKNALLLEFK
jgi:biotin carboxyl carrier protein